ncbi:unnamed protein product [Rotaria socialis]|uniref:Mic1 domain-containing protein n=1 Tax=Rotaria socialis TaxID=392032 RepID=A0A818PRK2_9BILA|nr:unnamed protein product [Rotaria socialis]CAF4334719.1 unnamed protein product [Rotaria socialis]
MTNNQSGYFLKLSSQPIIFEPISNGTSVFYDKDNQQLFCIEMSYEQEENTDSFRFTRRKKQNRCIISNSIISENQLNLNQEQLIRNIENKIEMISSTYFWKQFESYFLEWINNQLTSIDILCYGLGHISSSISSQYQYALLKLLEKTFQTKIQTIYLYDPIWTKDEYKFLRNNNSFSKYEILKENNQAYQTTNCSSFIYIPFCSKPIHNNLLYSNWNRKNLKEILFFGNSLDKFANEIQFDQKKFFYIYQAASFAGEKSLPLFEHYTNAFNEQVLTSFDRTSVPIINEKEIVQLKREKIKKMIDNKNQLKKITIEQLSDEIWSLHIKPIYSTEDEIVVSSDCVTVKGNRHEQAYSFRLEDKGAIQSIKFNPDLSVLAIKRNSNSVEFLNFAPIPQTNSSSRTSMSTATTILQPDTIEYSQLSKTKPNKFYDFNWLSDKEIVFVTDQAIEHYFLNAEKRTLRPLKHQLIININWQLFSREMNILLISAGSPSGNALTPFSFHKMQQQQLVKLPKFEVDLPQAQTMNQRSNSVASNASTQSASRRCSELTERDCMLATIYDKAYLLVIRQVFRVAGQGSVEVVLYQIEADHKPAQKRHILRLNLYGKCALNVVDNLILIHHQPTKTTHIYDIEESSTSQYDGFQTIHEPLLAQLCIQPINANWQLASSSIGTPSTPIELYSSNWIVFLPNVIIDVKIGYLWYLVVHLDILLDLIPERLRLIDILLRRINGKASILTLLRTLLTNVIAPVQIDSNNISNISSCNVLDLWIDMIDRINRVYVEKSPNRPLLDQSDIYSVLSLFSTIVSISSIGSTTTHHRSLSIASNDTVSDDNHQTKTLKFATSIVIEYIRSLNGFNIPADYFIYELLVNLLVKNNQFFQLQQLIQYQVLTDSLKLACLLLSLSNKQQPTTQIALDMLKRLTNANEEIVEILLGNNFVVEALQFCIDHLPITRTLARKLLESALKSDELLSSTTSNQKILFFTVYSFFEEYFLRATTISALAQSANSDEQKDDLELFKSLFNLHFRNSETDVANIQ